MVLQLTSGIEAPADRLSAWYVGPNQWNLPWLPERTVSTIVAVAAICAGEALRKRPAIDSPQWDQIHFGAAALGLSAQGLAKILNIHCPIPALRVPRRADAWILSGGHR